MTNDMKKMNNTELNQVNGGVDGMVGLYDGEYKTVRVEKNYLALRSDPSYKYENEIGKLYTGDKVKVCGNGAFSPHDFGGGYTEYIWVYAPTLNKSGWVNANFLR